jgi:hypothetical protein
VEGKKQQQQQQQEAADKNTDLDVVALLEQLAAWSGQAQAIVIHALYIHNGNIPEVKRYLDPELALNDDEGGNSWTDMGIRVFTTKEDQLLLGEPTKKQNRLIRLLGQEKCNKRIAWLTAP